MAIRNGISLGYPFIEAVESALPLCDEFIISEGFSDDDTFKILNDYFGSIDKVKIFQDPWDKESLKGSAVRNALNKARQRCKFEYIFEIDANEIVPEKDIPFIRNLPEIYPKKQLFAFPYYQMLGSEILFTEEFRFRMGKNLRSIQVLWDGYTMGHKLNLSTLFESGTFSRVINRMLTVILEDRISGGYTPEQYVYLPQPIYRYYSLFPESFFNKMSSKLSLQPGRDYDKFEVNNNDGRFKEIWDEYINGGEYDIFWEKVYDLTLDLIKEGADFNKEFIERRIIDRNMQPGIIQPQFGKKFYTPPKKNVNS